MHPAIRLGLEVPALGPDDRPDGEMPLHEVALAMEAAGVGALWLAEGAVAGAIDPIPLAGALAARTASIGIGVVCRPSRGRHPSVLARDVITIDRLSDGRAAVCLLDDGGGPSDAERLTEAGGILHLLLSEQEVTVTGRFYEVAELTIRPRPMSPAGPPVLAGLEPAAIGGDPVEALIEAGVDAIVVGGSPDDVAAARRRVDGFAPSGRVPALVWRGELTNDPDQALSSARLRRDAGADGLIVRLGAAAVSGLGFVPREVEAEVAALGALATRLD